MTGSAPLSYRRATEEVRAMLDRGTPFAHVEEAIDTTPTPPEEKAALWLLAWSLPDRWPQGQDIRPMLAHLASPDRAACDGGRTYGAGRFGAASEGQPSFRAAMDGRERVGLDTRGQTPFQCSSAGARQTRTSD